jgi:plastocyanin
MSMRSVLPVPCAIVLTLMAASPADAVPVKGTVRTITRPGVDAAVAVVYAEPLGGKTPKSPQRATLTQKGKTFRPHVLAVPVGSTVDFPNDDPIFHNVFSLSPPLPFDLGLYRSGASRSRLFTQPGTWRVFCNIHPQMSALVVVTPTPYVTMTDAAGAYALDLPPGRYRLTALSERAAAVSAEIEVGGAAAAAPDLRLDESAFVAVPHKNKFGLDYPRAAYDRP